MSIRLLRPWLILSLGLHSVILLLPFIPETPPILPEQADFEPINITQLPAATPLPLPLAPAAPAPPITLQPSPPPTPPPSPLSVPSQIPLSPPSPLSPQPAPPPSPASSPPPVASSPSPLSSPSPSSSPPPRSSAPAPSPESTDPFAEFPHLEDVESGCGDLDHCWRSLNTRWRTVEQTLHEDLLAQGYELTELPLDNDTGRKVYQVAKAGEVQYYLALISTFDGGTVYLLTEEPMTTAEMDAIAQG